MIILNEKKDCCGCGACQASCPQGCIYMKKDEEGFLYPHIDMSICVNCGICETVCPIININVSEKEKRVDALAVYAKTEQYVKDSSSGGVFSVLAEAIIKEGGIVFGAAFDDKWNVQTSKAESIETLASLKKAKYVQCTTNSAYVEIQHLLLKGIKILYCSTPCQIAGLFSFLGKTYDNLYTLDLICHGVPSPDVWKHYLSLQKKEIKQVNFRDKRDGWEKNSISFLFADGRELVERNNQNMYMQAFLQGLSVRPSCFSCRFKGLNRLCDITLGDLWGAEHQCPDGYNKSGTSLIIIHSRKGHFLIDGCKDKFHIVKAPMPASIVFNRAIKYSLKEPAKRSLFMEKYKDKDWDILLHECLSVENVPQKRSFLNQIKVILKKIFTCYQ